MSIMCCLKINQNICWRFIWKKQFFYQTRINFDVNGTSFEAWNIFLPENLFLKFLVVMKGSFRGILRIFCPSGFGEFFLTFLFILLSCSLLFFGFCLRFWRRFPYPSFWLIKWVFNFFYNRFLGHLWQLPI
jgi:hypothetical protein